MRGTASHPERKRDFRYEHNRGAASERVRTARRYTSAFRFPFAINS